MHPYTRIIWYEFDRMMNSDENVLFFVEFRNKSQGLNGYSLK